MTIYVKIGTWPATRMAVVRKRKPPEIGEVFELKDPEQRYAKPIRVRCEQIKEALLGETLYFVERW